MSTTKQLDYNGIDDLIERMENDEKNRKVNLMIPDYKQRPLFKPPLTTNILAYLDDSALKYFVNKKEERQNTPQFGNREVEEVNETKQEINQKQSESVVMENDDISAIDNIIGNIDLDKLTKDENEMNLNLNNAHLGVDTENNEDNDSDNDSDDNHNDSNNNDNSLIKLPMITISKREDLPSSPPPLSQLIGAQNSSRSRLNTERSRNDNENSGKELWHAIDQGRFIKVRTLIANGADPNWKNRNWLNWTALHLCASAGYEDIIDLLVDKGVNVNVTDRDGATPLIMASSKGYLNIVKTLAKRWARINARNNKDGWGYSPLHAAVKNGHYDVVEFLLERGADLTLTNDIGQTPFDLAIENQFQEIAWLLDKFQRRHKNRFKNKKRGEDIEQDNQSITSNNDNNTKSNSRQLDRLFNKSNNIDNMSDDNSIGSGLMNINNNNENEKEEDDDNKRENRHLWKACKDGYLKGVTKWISRRANINWRNPNWFGATPLLMACKSSFFEVTCVLLNESADPNIPDNDGFTPLHAACSGTDIRVVEKIIEAGGDVHASTHSGATILHKAASRGNTSMIRTLLPHFPNLNLPDHWGSTALHRAASGGHQDVVQLLIENGADVNISNCTGYWSYTPLHAAVKRGHINIIDLLLDNGADLNNVDQEGKTAIQLAKELYSVDIVNHMERRLI